MADVIQEEDEEVTQWRTAAYDEGECGGGCGYGCEGDGVVGVVGEGETSITVLSSISQRPLPSWNCREKKPTYVS